MKSDGPFAVSDGQVLPLGAFSRRTLLRGAAAATLVSVGTSRIATAVPTRQAGEPVDVAIVGAGIAGLTAARVLTKAGRSVVVLEARDRVGGRMVRQQIGPDAWVDLGGQWVGPTQERIIALADELGVKRFPWYHAGATRFVYKDISARFNGNFVPFSGEPPPLPADEVEDADRAWKTIEELAATVPPDAPWMAPDAERLDQETLASWIDRTTHTDFARFVVTLWARVGGSGAFEPDQVSVLHMAFTQAAGPQQEAPETDLFYGAAGQIPLLLAEELGDRIVLRSPVWGIAQEGEEVIVRTPQEEYRARLAIVAVPPTLTSGIVFDPPLPTQRLQLVQRMPMGSLLKVHAIYPNAFWREEGLNGVALSDLPTTPLTADSSPLNGEPGILTTFIAGTPADILERRSASERREAVLADLVTCFGQQAGSPTNFIEMNWPAETWTRGAFTSYMPPGAWTGYGEALRAPVGRIHWAGTETATRWNGYFDGGVRSGEAAAAAVLAEL